MATIRPVNALPQRADHAGVPLQTQAGREGERTNRGETYRTYILIRILSKEHPVGHLGPSIWCFESPPPHALAIKGS